MVSSLEIGNHISRLRNKASMTQSDLAKKVGVSAAVVSRMESGERAIGTDELHTILESIGTPEAAAFLETIGYQWEYLPKPMLGHPEGPILQRAETAFKNIKALSEKPTIPYPFTRRLEETLVELRVNAELVLSNEYAIAFVGNIGVGKSTAICRISGLEVVEDKGGLPTTVLDVGAGGITLCEVHISRGPGFGIFVEPKTEAEIYLEVREFARSFIASTDSDGECDDEEPGFAGTTKELDRAIRNMSGLTVKRTRLPDGTRERTDPIRNMAQNCASLDELALAIRTKMNLRGRIRRELWYPDLASKEPLPWLAEVFRQVNNGRHPEFSLPNRVEVIVPQTILQAESEDTLSFRLIDTKGIDDTAEREDLETLFNNPNALVVMCSTFNEAPSPSVQQLLDRAVRGGFPNIESKSAILVLPRPSEALAMRDDESFAVDTVDDGYELKGEQATNTLLRHGLPNAPIEFFNSLEDDPQRPIDFLIAQVNHLRNAYVAKLRNVIDGANALVQNHENEQVRAVQQEASVPIKNWLEYNRQITPFRRKPEASLFHAIREMRYASSLQASVRRGGVWHNLDYAHQLGFGTRAMVQMAVMPKLEEFRTLANTLMDTPSLTDAADLVQQSIRIIESGTTTLLNDSQSLGRTIYAEHMEDDTKLWDSCVQQWGKGSGYRNRVLDLHTEWFEDNREAVDSQVNPLIEAAWQGILNRVMAILPSEYDEPE